MNDSKISVRYAKALFLSAMEENVLDVVLKDMQLILSSLSVQGFTDYMESPVIKTSSKRELIKNVFGEGITGLSMNFYNLLLTNKREAYIGDIIRNFMDLYRDEKGIKAASLSIPFEITDEYRKRFISLLEDAFKSKIEMDEKLDRELIGGFVLKVEDQQFDASVKTSLAKIKKQLLQTAIEN